MIKKICIVTGTRAEYGLFHPIIKQIISNSNLELQLIVTTMHLKEEFGFTYQQIQNDALKEGFEISIMIDNLVQENSKTDNAKSTANVISELSNAYENLQPDCVLLLGDRFETLGAATAALLMQIPIAHIHGGEISEGAVDEQIRHAITKMASLHFCSTEIYKNRIIQMGEQPNNVFNVGAPGIDNISNGNFSTVSEISKSLQWNFDNRTILFTYHSETLNVKNSYHDISSILKILKNSNCKVLFTYANADEGGDSINSEIEKFVATDLERYCVVKSLGLQRYLSAMKHCNFVMGNSSSGIIEAASFHKPVVNIGNRQKGRLCAKNVLHCTVENLPKTLEHANSETFKHKCLTIANIYGDGKSASKIASLLENRSFTVKKQFFDTISSNN